MLVVVKTWEWILRFPSVYLVIVAIGWMWGENSPEVTSIERLAITALMIGTMGVLIWITHPLMGFGIFMTHMFGPMAIAWIGLTMFYIIPNWVGIVVIALLVLVLIVAFALVVLSYYK